MAERKAFLLRLDPAVWQALERCAADELRSVNGQVEFILREAIKRRGVTLSQPEDSGEAEQPQRDSAEADGASASKDS